MNIKTVEIYELKVPMERTFYNALGGISEKIAFLICIKCECGLTGWGECWANFPRFRSRDRSLYMNNNFIPYLIGKDARLRKKIIESLFKHISLLGIQHGNLGMLYQLISAVDIALWDIEGKLKEKAICQLLSHSPIKKVDLYASGIDQFELEKNLRLLFKKGFRKIKMRIGFGAESDLRAINIASKIFKDYESIALDVNQGFDYETSVKTAHLLKPYNIAWIEEPLSADDIQGLYNLQKEISIPIATGENIYSLKDFKELSKFVQILNPDLCKQGGITNLLKIHSAISNDNCRLIPHNFGTAIGMAATIHFIAAMCKNPILEVDCSQNPLITELLYDFPLYDNASIIVPNEPGLGIKVNEKIIDKYRVF